MLTKVETVAFQGIDVFPVTAEVHIASGLPNFSIVGLADKSVAESKERLRAAFNSIGFALPAKRITVNLAPADVQKEGTHYDLPLALGLLAAMDVFPIQMLEKTIVMGELGLDGKIAPVAGILPASVYANQQEYSFICPAIQGGEAAWSGNKNIFAANSLTELIQMFKGEFTLPAPHPEKIEICPNLPDMKDIKGQESAKRAAEVCAAGRHNMLMIGPPGAGKSMLAARIPSLLPPLTAKEILEISMIHSVAGLIKEGKLLSERPFRSPHHSASMPALVGGGQKAKPGEISLAHKGVLFLDELPEFSRATLEALRQPMETGSVSVARVNLHVTYPAQFQLIAAMNPCRCGYLGQQGHECSRAPRCGEDYQSRISGPLLDRIDMHVSVSAVAPWDLVNVSEGESSVVIAERVAEALEIQRKRYVEYGVDSNAKVSGTILEKTLKISDKAQQMLIQAAEKMNLSARGYHRVLRVARTIADLVHSNEVELGHIAEALSYRQMSYKR